MPENETAAYNARTIPYEGTDCTPEEAVAAVEEGRAAYPPVMEGQPETPMQRFYADLLPWVREHGAPDAAAVTSVESYGTDWAGGTEEGFHSEFEVTIRGERPNGERFYMDVTGKDLMSLWKWTVREVFGG